MDHGGDLGLVERDGRNGADQFVEGDEGGFGDEPGLDRGYGVGGGVGGGIACMCICIRGGARAPRHSGTVVDVHLGLSSRGHGVQICWLLVLLLLALVLVLVPSPPGINIDTLYPWCCARLQW